MRHRIGLSLGIALTVSLAAPHALNAEGARRLPHGMEDGTLRAQSFSVSGTFSGSIGGEIKIDGVAYTLAKDATIYEIGKGVLPPGAVVTDRMVYMSGLMRGHSPVVYGVIVRPALDLATLGDDPSTHIRIKDDRDDE